jgi:ferrous iron transport protein A
VSLVADPVLSSPSVAFPGVPLTLVRPGASVTVSAVRGEAESRRQLADLGFIVGSQVSVVCARQGDLIVTVKGARIALDRATARRVMTE